jgi:hypothetical protein
MSVDEVIRRSDAAHELLDWLRVEAEKRGAIDEISWDHPDMYRVVITLDRRLMAVVWMDTEKTAGGYDAWGRYVVSDNLDSGPDFYAHGDVERHAIAGDYGAAAAAMRADFVRLFAGLDGMPRPA